MNLALIFLGKNLSDCRKFINETLVTNLMLRLALDIVSFYRIFKVEEAFSLEERSEDIKPDCDKNIDVKILDTGSTFEDLYLPHVTLSDLNFDADHMVIINDIIVRESDPCVAETETYIYKNCTESKSAESVTACQNIARFLNTGLLCKFFREDVFYIHQGFHEGYVLLSKENLNNKVEYIANWIQETCLSSSRFVSYCSANFKFENLLHMGRFGHITGPSFTVSTLTSDLYVQRDFVFAVRCNSWPEQAREWVTRQRDSNWPTEKQIKDVEFSGCFLVPVASHHNKAFCGYEWRLSFSKAELTLIKDFHENLKLGYALLKNLIKYEMKKYQLTVFASYHLKTCLLWFAEKFGLEKIQQWSLENIIQNLLEFFIKLYSENCVPNYFVRTNNMIDHKKQSEIKQCVSLLITMEKNLLRLTLNYIDTNLKLPVVFDESFTIYFNSNNIKRTFQLIKYNFLVMQLLHELKTVVYPPYTHTNTQLVQKAKQLHKAETEIETGIAHDSSDADDSVSINQILELLNNYLEVDDIAVSEKSGVLLGVFNMILLSYPDFSQECKERSKEDLDQYISKCSVIMYVLQWVGSMHELYADVIYQRVVEKGANEPNIFSQNKKSAAFKKILDVAASQLTKQSRSVTGSLLKSNKDGELLEMCSYFAVFLLCYDLELAYVAYEGVAGLFGLSPVDYIWITIKHSSWNYNKMKAIELIMAYEELKDALTDKQRIYIQNIKDSEYTSS